MKTIFFFLLLTPCANFAQTERFVVDALVKPKTQERLITVGGPSASIQAPNLIFAQDKNTPRRCIVVFGAHADDVESIAGGTLAKYIAMGYEGIYVGAINNLAGCNLERTPYFKSALFTISNSPYRYPVDALETSQMREEEALQAATVFKAIPVFLNFNEPWFSMGRKQIDYGTYQYGQYWPIGRRLISLATIVSEDVNVVCDLLK